jgi:hypothetical protein
MTPQEVADRLEIQDALTAYCTALDVPGRRWDEWDRCFAPDATCDFKGGGDELSPAVPHQQVREVFKRNDAIRISTQHLLLNMVIAVDGDTATARTECLILTLSRTDSPDRIARNVSTVWYDDALVRTPDGWRIRHRACTPRWGQVTEVERGAISTYL